MTNSMTNRITPQKRFSQNFLTDNRTAAKIAAVLEASTDDVVLEIGPGTGALTKHLVALPSRRIVAVDLDPRAVEAISGMVQQSGGRLSVQQGDVLKVRLDDMFADVPSTNRRVIGNIPYAITSEILFWLFEARTSMARAVIMMQKEVALRCVAKPGTKDYGVLTVAAWYATTPKLMFTVQPGSFFPRPSVTSAVVRFDMRTEVPPVPFAPFMSFVRAAFSQRRKVMANALASWANQQGIALRTVTLPEHLSVMTLRAEALSPDQLVELYLNLTKPESQPA